MLATYAYTNLGQVSTISRGNGIGTTYGYDGYGRMTSLAHGGAANVTFGYSYNPAGQIAHRTVSNGAYSYAPGQGVVDYARDGMSRVTSINGIGVGYDANQNISYALGSAVQPPDRIVGKDMAIAADHRRAARTVGHDPFSKQSQVTVSGLAPGGLSAL